MARAGGRGVDVVMRMHARRAPLWFRGRGHSKGNRRVWWHKSPRPTWMTEEEYGAMPEWLGLRAMRGEVRRRGFRTKRLVRVTTRTDAAAYPADDWADLYRRRWQAELDLRSFKTTLQLDVLGGQTPARARKEVGAHRLASNAVRGLMVQAARSVGVRPDESSFTGALPTWNGFRPSLRQARSAVEASQPWAVLIAAIGQHRAGDRPDRYEPRAVKRRPKNDPQRCEPRAAARRRWREKPNRAGKKC